MNDTSVSRCSRVLVTFIHPVAETQASSYGRTHLFESIVLRASDTLTICLSREFVTYLNFICTSHNAHVLAQVVENKTLLILFTILGQLHFTYLIASFVMVALRLPGARAETVLRLFVCLFCLLIYYPRHVHYRNFFRMLLTL